MNRERAIFLLIDAIYGLVDGDDTGITYTQESICKYFGLNNNEYQTLCDYGLDVTMFN